MSSTSVTGATGSAAARPARLFVLFGVSGSGKTTIGMHLARRLRIPFLDADDYHSAANKQKMRAGHALTDDDRWPWLARLNELLREHSNAGSGCVLACSALREVYRGKLQEGMAPGTIHFVLLDGSRELIGSRIAHRHHEYMNNSLLDSQFATLEEPEDAVRVTNDGDPDEVVERLLQQEGMA